MSLTNINSIINHTYSVNSIADIHYIWGYPTCVEDFRVSQWFSFLIAGVFLTVASIFGIVGNALSASYLRTLIHREKTPRHLLLLTLSYFDFFVCLYAFVFFGLSVISSHFYSLDWYIKWICRWNTHTYPFHVIAYLGSTLITLAITFERLVVVFKPLQAQSYITYGRTRSFVYSTYAFIVTFSIPLFVYYIFADHKTPYDSDSNTCEYGYVPRESETNRTSKSGSPLLDSIANIYFSILFFLVLWMPLPVITIANVVLLIKIKQSYKEKQTLSICQMKSLRTTKILMSILLVYMFCNILQYCTTLAQTLFGAALCLELRVIVDCTVTVNCAVNYLIYCSFGSRKRESVRIMFNMVVNPVPNPQQQNRRGISTLSGFKSDL